MTDDDKAILAEVLRETIERAARSRCRRGFKRLRGIRAKLGVRLGAGGAL